MGRIPLCYYRNCAFYSTTSWNTLPVPVRDTDKICVALWIAGLQTVATLQHSLCVCAQEQVIFKRQNGGAYMSITALYTVGQSTRILRILTPKPCRSRDRVSSNWRAGTTTQQMPTNCELSKLHYNLRFALGVKDFTNSPTFRQCLLGKGCQKHMN